MSMTGCYTLKISCDYCNGMSAFKGQKASECRRKARLAGWLIVAVKNFVCCRVCKRKLGLAP